jgi:hypothetical protein
LKLDATELDRQLAETRLQMSAIYASRRGKLASWLRLLPKRPSKLTHTPEVGPPDGDIRQQAQQPSVASEQNYTEIPVHEMRHTSNLLALNGSAFVDALYRTFLKRSPDRAGRDHFMGRLQRGDAKEDVLLAIATSREARAVGTSIEGVAELKRARARSGRWSLIRSGSRALEARLNRLEHRIGEAHNSVMNRLERMESSLDHIQSKLDNYGSARQIPGSREAGVYVQGAPVSIKRGISVRPADGAAEFINELRASVQSSTEAVSLRNGR